MGTQAIVPEPSEHEQNICWCLSPSSLSASGSQDEENAAGRRQEGTRRMRTCWTCKTLSADQTRRWKQKKKKKLETPPGMEETNRALLNYKSDQLDKGELQTLQETPLLVLRIFWGWDHGFIRLLWQNCYWRGLSYRCKSCLRYLNFDRELETTQSSDPGDLFVLVSSSNTQLRSHDSME